MRAECVAQSVVLPCAPGAHTWVMAATSTPDPSPTRDGVTVLPGVHVGRDDIVTLPARGGRLRSWRRYDLAYNRDQMVIWSATPRGIARSTVAGPEQAAVYIRSTVHDDERYHRGPTALAVFWLADDPTERYGHGSREEVALITGMSEIVKGLVARPTAIPEEL